MAWLADEMKKLDPHGLPGESDENLVQAIAKTIPLVDQFGRVAQAAAEMNSSDATSSVYKGFEQILSSYELAPGVFGSFRKSDFDFFKFVGQELCAILFAHLIRAERWALIDSVARQKLYWNRAQAAVHVGIEFLSAHLLSLDEVRNRRIGQRRLSIHADLLKERHERVPPVGGVAWDEFCDADLLLFLRSHSGGEGFAHRWYPRSAPYLFSTPRRLLVSATTVAGAKDLAIAVGEKDLGALRTRVKSGRAYLSEGIMQMGGMPDFDLFDVSVRSRPSPEWRASCLPGRRSQARASRTTRRKTLAARAC